MDPLWLDRRRQADFSFAVGAQILDLRAEIEQLDFAALRTELGAQRFGCGSVDRAIRSDDNAISTCAIDRDQTLLDFLGHKLRIAFQRVTPAATTPTA